MTQNGLEPIQEQLTAEYRKANAQLAGKEVAHISTPLKQTWDEIVELRGYMRGLKAALAIVIARRDDQELSLEMSFARPPEDML